MLLLLLGIYYDIISSIRHSCLYLLQIETQINNKLKRCCCCCFFVSIQALLLLKSHARAQQKTALTVHSNYKQMISCFA